MFIQKAEVTKWGINVMEFHFFIEPLVLTQFLCVLLITICLPHSTELLAGCSMAPNDTMLVVLA